MPLKFNFLDLEEILRHKKKLKRKQFFFSLRLIFYSLFITLFLAFLFSLPYYFSFRFLYQEAQLGKKNLESAQNYVLLLNWKKTSLALQAAEENFKTAREELKKFNFIKWIPWFDQRLKTAHNLLITGIQTSSALKEVITMIEDISGIVKSSIPSIDQKLTLKQLSLNQKKEILKKIYETGPRLEAAKQKIDSAVFASNQITKDEAGESIGKSILPFRSKLLSLSQSIDRVLPMSQILPLVLGYPKDKTYLFLLQNSSELRPTGGFIGTYGVLALSGGEMLKFQTDNVYKLDGPAEGKLTKEAPLPLQKYMGVKAWYLRDANWSPHFPQSAALAEWLYLQEAALPQATVSREEIPARIDGVIAVTPLFIQALLDITGEIEIEGQKFNSLNLIDILEYQAGKGYIEQGKSQSQRKDIIGKLAAKMTEKLYHLPYAKWNNIIKAVDLSLKEKNILVYDKDPYLQKLMEKYNWDGRVKEVSPYSDYLLVIDANLASLKTDQVMKRKINYSLKQEKDYLKARVDIIYQNIGSFTWKTTRYRTYTRVYVPKGSQLIKGRGMMENDKIINPLKKTGIIDQGQELNKTYFGSFISIEPGETKTLSFEYKLPGEIYKSVKENLYNLFIQKQPGTSHNLTLSLDFGKKIESASPEEAKKEWGDGIYKWESDLRIDKEIKVKFK